MAKERLLTDAQHSRYYDIYMREARSPIECAAILMAEFEDEGLKVTPKQLSTYAYERHWTKRKKKLINKAERRAHRLVPQMAENLARQKLGVAEQQKDFLEKSASLGAKAMKKAEEIMDRPALNARDLSSAVNAAAKGVEMFRRAVGLEDGNTNSLASGGNTFHFHFARSEGSPFAKSAVDVQTEQVPSCQLDPPEEDTSEGAQTSNQSDSQTAADPAQMDLDFQETSHIT